MNSETEVVPVPLTHLLPEPEASLNLPLPPGNIDESAAHDRVVQIKSELDQAKKKEKAAKKERRKRKKSPPEIRFPPVFGLYNISPSFSRKAYFKKIGRSKGWRRWKIRVGGFPMRSSWLYAQWQFRNGSSRKAPILAKVAGHFEMESYKPEYTASLPASHDKGPMDLQLQTGYQSYAYALDTGPHRDSTEEAMVFCWRKCDSFEIFDMEFRRKPKVMTAWKLVYESHNRPDTTEEDVAGVPGVADLVEDVSSVEEEVAAVEENVAAVVAFHRYSPFRPRATFKFLWKSKSGKYDELWAQFAAITWLAIFSQHLHIYNPIRLDVPEDGMFRFGLPSGVSLNLGTLGLNLDAFRGRHVTQYRVNGSPTERYEENSKSVSGGFSYAGGY